MVHIAEHQDEASKDLPLEEGAASATPQDSDCPTLGAATMRSTRQHTPAQATRAPSGIAPAGALFAARELLCHPPSSTASPRAVRQWRDDVDRLLGIAHIGSIRPRPQSSRRHYEALASVHPPSGRAVPTKDLRAELNHRRAAEDTQIIPERPEDLRDKLNRRRASKNARLSLGKARECCRNLESHNLEQGPAAVVPQGLRDTRFQTGIPLAGVGCAALADHFRAATWPAKFRPHLPEKYDGTTNPSEFLQVYITAITAVGGDTAVMATYFHVALSGPARTWLMNQAPGSIHSWEELCVRFMANFASACQQHGVEAHLHALRQGPRETLQAFISRFTKVCGTIPRISDASIITAFR
jgi:hypothetical protein